MSKVTPRYLIARSPRVTKPVKRFAVALRITRLNRRDVAVSPALLANRSPVPLGEGFVGGEGADLPKRRRFQRLRVQGGARRSYATPFRGPTGPQRPGPPGDPRGRLQERDGDALVPEPGQSDIRAEEGILPRLAQLAVAPLGQQRGTVVGAFVRGTGAAAIAVVGLRQDQLDTEGLIRRSVKPDVALPGSQRYRGGRSGIFLEHKPRAAVPLA